jgi:hypothetical protein
LIVKVLSTPFKPKKIEDEAVEDIKGLSNVKEAFDVVALDIRRVVLSLEDNFTQQDKGLGGGDVVRRPPFLPDALVGFPGAFGMGAFEEAMLRGL